MGKRLVQVVGNGDASHFYNDEPRWGLKLCCNLPPFPVPDAYASCIVDFKFMKAMTEGSIICPYQWILGARPKAWMDSHAGYYMRASKQVKEFYTILPPYAKNYTDFNCGHMAVHYASWKIKADEVHLWGFDSIFDFNLRSVSDLYLQSARDNINNNRLSGNWRPIWEGLFTEFSNVKFVLHHFHDQLKIFNNGKNKPDNVILEVHRKK